MRAFSRLKTRRTESSDINGDLSVAIIDINEDGSEVAIASRYIARHVCVLNKRELSTMMPGVELLHQYEDEKENNPPKMEGYIANQVLEPASELYAATVAHLTHSSRWEVIDSRSGSSSSVVEF